MSTLIERLDELKKQLMATTRFQGAQRTISAALAAIDALRKDIG